MSPENVGAADVRTPQDARAQAKAEKAYRKALRPWFKKKRFVIPLVLVVLIALGSQLGGGSDAGTGTGAAQSNSADSAAQSDARIGTPVRDGKFEFTVDKVENAGSTIGTGPLAATAQGKYVLVRVDVKNIGDEPAMLDATSQTLFDSQGRKFQAVTEFGALPDAQKVFLENINPGNTVSDAPLLFDVPKDAAIDRIELHDSMFSGGVSVSLK